MEVDTPRNLRDDRMSDCRSIGSKYQPSSQLRKTSIGVMVDSVAKKMSGAAKEDEVAVLTERTNLNVENSIEVKKKGQRVAAPVKGKPIEAEAPEQERSPWITTRSLHQQSSFPETFFRAEQPATSVRQNKLNGQKNAPATHSVQFCTNKTSILQSDSGKKQFDGITYKRKGTKDGSTETVKEFSFAAAQEDHVSDKADKTETQTETLRLKLWEILGNISSPKSQHSNSQSHEVGANNLKPGQNFDQKGGEVVRPRQNSDTIETDSEDPDHTIRRPVTRSLTQKRVSPKVQVKRTKCGPSSGYIQKNQEKNIISFKEGWSRRVNGSANGGSSKPMRKKSDKKSTKIEPRKILFPEKDTSDKIQGESYRSKAMLPAEEIPSPGKKMGDFHHCLPENEREYIEVEKKIQEQNSRQAPFTDKTDQQEDFNSSANGDQQEDIANPSLKNVVDQQDDFESPTFRIKTPTSSSTRTSTPKMDQLEHDVPSRPPTKKRFTVGSIRSFRNLQTSKPDRYGSNAQTEYSGDAEELKKFPPQKAAFDIEEKDAEDGLSESSAEEQDCKSSAEGSPILEAYSGCREGDTLSPETGAAEKSNFTLCSTKRRRSCEGIRFDNISPMSPSPKGTGESSSIQEPLEQSQEDGLSRAIQLFCLELQKLKSRMKSETTRRSSEIVRSVADGISLQLQNLESHIQTDIGKLTGLSKSKRKRLEAKFEEQQNELKLIHEKFKEDINQHLQDFRNMLDGLEAHQIEFKGTLEKQKTSHRKLLLQMEEEVNTQLNDAERRITAIHELARGKMLQLKHVISLCLKEGVLC